MDGRKWGGGGRSTRRDSFKGNATSEVEEELKRERERVERERGEGCGGKELIRGSFRDDVDPA